MNPSNTYKLAIFASGEGTNAEAILEHFELHPRISVAIILSNRAEAGVLLRAADWRIPQMTFDKEQFTNGDVFELLQDHGITHVVLAGFLWLMPMKFISAFQNRMINIHPALLPNFGGKGMFGMKVHEAVKAAGVKESGITIHQVNEQFDEGKILFQMACPIDSTDSVETIAVKVRALELEYYPTEIEKWILSSETI